ncbi:MAG: hypothetical protein QCI82_11405 [Candidatus Thermoplasmatota archaeon]|nr:hypothetical protein [Candidatus Thermoplasmatota archaeon]
MDRTLKQVIIIVITLVVFIAVFWFALPMLGLREMLGGAYIVVAIVGGIILSLIISRVLNKVIK